jgi:hypothetical protein
MLHPPSPQSQQQMTEDSSFLDRPRLWWISLLAMLAALTVPILSVEVPPLTDYPNHLARCYILAFGKTDPILSQMFSSHWQIIPNIGVDLILPALMHIFPPLIAGRIVLALCLLLPVSGTVALSYAYFRQRSFWQIAAGFAAYNALLFLGFMNFELAIGIALWGAAGWVRFREQYPAATIALSAVIATIAFFFHLVGFCFFVLLIGTYELELIFRVGLRTKAALQNAATRTLLVAITLAIPLVLYLLSPLGKVAGTIEWARFKDKVFNLLVPFQDYSFGFDLLLIAPVIAFLLLCILTRRARVSPAGLTSSLILLLGYAIMPRGMKGGYFADLRLPIMLGFMVFAAFIPSRLTLRQKVAAGLVLVALFLTRIGYITTTWVRAQRDVSDVREVIASVTPGSTVLAADVTWHDNPDWFASMPRSRWLPHLTVTYTHLAAFALLDRHAFWSNIFAAPAQQPLQLKEPYRDLRVVESPPPGYHLLAAKTFSSTELKRFPFLPDWSNKFDYVLVLNAEGAPELEHFLPDRLQFVERRGIAALLKVKRQP